MPHTNSYSQMGHRMPLEEQWRVKKVNKTTEGYVIW